MRDINTPLEIGMEEIDCSFIDGPYIYIHEQQVDSYSILCSKDAHHLQIKKESFPLQPGINPTFITYVDNSPSPATSAFFEFEIDTTTSYIEADCEYNEAEKLVAISDIEGNFSGLKNILLATGVMNDQFNWTFDTGHLVITGDLIDRGANVLACLWLVYKLDMQAKSQGGKVHYLLGNHEVMNYNGDFRYVNHKYLKYIHALHWDPRNLFAQSTVLGKWHREKNSVEKIGKYLFLHAGFSKEILQRKFSLQQINDLIRSNLDKPIEEIEGDAQKSLMDDLGPLWYRGLIDQNRKYHAATPEDVQETLNYYKVKKIVVGHTLVPFIQQFHDKKVIGIDTNMPGKHQSRIQSLLIDKGKEFVVDEMGSKWKL